MKKNTIKAFTLVEMLIVIVIIGILIASLMPRMQQAQSRARDVTRKNDLSQMQTAIISYLGDTGSLPKCKGDLTYCEVSNDDIKAALKAGGLDVLPADPIDSQKYYYGRTKRNNHDAQGFRLAANTEVAGVSNYAATDVAAINGKVTDTATFVACKNVTEADTVAENNCSGPGGKYWYIVTY